MKTKKWLPFSWGSSVPALPPEPVYDQTHRPQSEKLVESASGIWSETAIDEGARAFRLQDIDPTSNISIIIDYTSFNSPRAEAKPDGARSTLDVFSNQSAASASTDNSLSQPNLLKSAGTAEQVPSMYIQKSHDRNYTATLPGPMKTELNLNESLRVAPQMDLTLPIYRHELLIDERATSVGDCITPEPDDLHQPQMGDPGHPNLGSINNKDNDSGHSPRKCASRPILSINIPHAPDSGSVVQPSSHNLGTTQPLKAQSSVNEGYEDIEGEGPNPDTPESTTTSTRSRPAAPSVPPGFEHLHPAIALTPQALFERNKRFTSIEEQYPNGVLAPSAHLTLPNVAEKIEDWVQKSPNRSMASGASTTPNKLSTPSNPQVNPLTRTAGNLRGYRGHRHSTALSAHTRVISPKPFPPDIRQFDTLPRRNIPQSHRDFPPEPTVEFHPSLSFNGQPVPSRGTQPSCTDSNTLMWAHPFHPNVWSNRYAYGVPVPAPSPSQLEENAKNHSKAAAGSMQPQKNTLSIDQDIGDPWAMRASQMAIMNEYTQKYYGTNLDGARKLGKLEPLREKQNRQERNLQLNKSSKTATNPRPSSPWLD